MSATHESGSTPASTVDGLLFWVIAVSSAAFVLILALAAYWDHTIIWLHLFQSFQYLAIVLLAARANRWAYLVGIAVGAFWTYVGTFVTNFVESGFENLGLTLRTGVLTRADQIIAVFALTSQLIIILACLIAYFRLNRRKSSDWLRFVVAIAAAISYLIASFALFQPRYLGMVPKLLHPHWI
jgi:hypothetical protein